MAGDGFLEADRTRDRCALLVQALPVGLNLGLNLFVGKSLAGQIGTASEPDGRPQQGRRRTRPRKFVSGRGEQERSYLLEG
jgi:hypothetical protein